jgi:hypothetical protein
MRRAMVGMILAVLVAGCSGGSASRMLSNTPLDRAPLEAKVALVIDGSATTSTYGLGGTTASERRCVAAEAPKLMDNDLLQALADEGALPIPGSDFARAYGIPYWRAQRAALRQCRLIANTNPSSS